jgi:hypothetical protein
VSTAGPGHDRSELLAAIGDVTDGTLAREQTVQRLLTIAVPVFADFAAI